MDKVLEALERLKTAPTFMGGTAEYQACTKSETLLMQDYETVKQFILKAQGPKQYLKWEDLEFSEDRQTIKVLLNGEKYFVKYKKEYLFGYYEKVEITNGTFILCTLGSAMKQFFNDLRLERVEE